MNLCLLGKAGILNNNTEKNPSGAFDKHEWEVNPQNDVSVSILVFSSGIFNHPVVMSRIGEEHCRTVTFLYQLFTLSGI